MSKKAKSSATKVERQAGWRKKPANPYWSHTMIREAKLFKLFTGRVDLAIFSSTESVRTNARLHSTRKDWSQVKLPEGKVSFTLGARVHDKYGKLVYGAN